MVVCITNRYSTLKSWPSLAKPCTQRRDDNPMLTLNYKLDGTPAQFAAIDEGIRTVQFIRNKCLRAWMDRLPEGKTFEAMSLYTAVLAQAFAFASRLG